MLFQKDSCPKARIAAVGSYPLALLHHSKSFNSLQYLKILSVQAFGSSQGFPGWSWELEEVFSMKLQPDGRCTVHGEVKVGVW